MKRGKKMPEGVYVQLHSGDPRIDEAMSGPLSQRQFVTMSGQPATNEKWVGWALWDGAAKRRWWQFWKRRKPIASGLFDDDGNVA